MIFDSTQYTNKPDLEGLYGIKPLTVIYPQSLWPNGNVTQALPDLGHFESQLTSFIDGNDWCLDIEHWDVKGDDDSAYESIRKYILAGLVARHVATTSVGYYGVVPIRDYWRAISDKDTQDYKSWAYECERTADIEQAIDVMYPSIYTFYNDPTNWVKYAERNVEMARKVNKPIYAFLWPQYHDSNQTLGLQYIDPTFWRLQLDTIHSLCEGFVIWGGWDFANNQPAAWDESAPWWVETKDFLTTL